MQNFIDEFWLDALLPQLADVERDAQALQVSLLLNEVPQRLTAVDERHYVGNAAAHIVPPLLDLQALGLLGNCLLLFYEDACLSPLLREHLLLSLLQQLRASFFTEVPPLPIYILVLLFERLDLLSDDLLSPLFGLRHLVVQVELFILLGHSVNEVRFYLFLVLQSSFLLHRMQLRLLAFLRLRQSRRQTLAPFL